MRLLSTPSLANALRHPAAFLSGDSANIRRLAEHIDCSLEDAAAVYRLARRHGYPTAYRSVFEASGEIRLGVRQRRTFGESIGARIAPARPRARTASGRSG